MQRAIPIVSRKRDLPGEASPRVTMHQIAKAAHVSLGTVSHVLNETAPVRDTLKKRVLDAIASLGYRPNQLSRGLRLNRTSLIGVVIPDITNPFFPAVVRGIEDVAYKNSFRLVLCNADNDSAKEAAYLNDLRSFLPAGIVVFPSLDSIVSPNSSSPPIVCVDSRPKGWKGDSVTVANIVGGRQAARHLLEMGHRQFGVVSVSNNLTVFKDRLKGFLSCTKEAGIHVEPAYVQEAFFDRASGYAAGQRLLKLTPRPTAIFAASDMMAIGVLAAVRDAGLRCPEDVSVVSFDGLDLSEMTFPALTSIVQPSYELGAVAAQLLLDRIQGLDTPAQHIVLETKLALRDSVARLEVSETMQRRFGS